MAENPKREVLKKIVIGLFVKNITNYANITNIFRWATIVAFRKYIISWGYFWYFEWKKQKTSQNSPISTILLII